MELSLLTNYHVRNSFRKVDGNLSLFPKRYSVGALNLPNRPLHVITGKLHDDYFQTGNSLCLYPFNHLTPRSDHYINSSNNFNTLSSKQVMRIKRIIN